MDDFIRLAEILLQHGEHADLTAAGASDHGALILPQAALAVGSKAVKFRAPGCD